MMRQAVAISLMLASAACSSPNRDVAIRPVNVEATATGKEAIARGQLLFSRGEYALALDAYRRAMRQDPADANALNGVAISYAAIGRHDLARDYFELALARAPMDERIHRNFARSLTAQGLQGEANALLAEIGQGVQPGGARRPTLAQIAMDGGKRPAAPVRVAGLELERVSMGEVRLRTVSTGVAQAALPGRAIAQLNTAIVTVADGTGAAPAISLSRSLAAPITTLPTPVQVTVAGCGKSKDGTSAGASRPCATMAGGDEPDSLFQKLWAWSGGRG